MENETTASERDEQMEVAYTANGEMEAQAIRAALEAAGIPAELKMEAAQQLFAVTVDGLGAIKVLVPAGRLEEAKAVVANPADPLEEPATEESME
jgi:hypothetical protein